MLLRSRKNELFLLTRLRSTLHCKTEAYLPIKCVGIVVKKVLEVPSFFFV